MIISMMIPLLVAGIAQAEPLFSKEDIISDAMERLLDGQDLPAETERRIRALPAHERLEVLIVLRRSGMLTGPIWPVDRILSPTEQTEGATDDQR